MCIRDRDGESFGVFGTMQTAGKAVNWAKDLFGLPSARALDREAARAPAGSDGLIFLPYLEGERSPIFDPNARGVFFGIGAQHRREHFLRAVLEGVAYALRSILEVYRGFGPFEELRIIGGGAQSEIWTQIISDVCDARLWTVRGDSNSPVSYTHLTLPTKRIV